MNEILSPNVVPEIHDFTGRIGSDAPTIAAAVIKSNKGSVNEAVLCTSVAQFVEHFGEGDPSLGDAHECLMEYLRAAPAYVKRVDKDSGYSGLSLHNVQNYKEGEQVGSVYKNFLPAATLSESFAAAMKTGGYEDGNINVQTLEIQGELVTSNDIAVSYSLGGGQSGITVTTTFTTNSDTTLEAFATALQTSLRTNVDTNITVKHLAITTGQSSNYLQISAPQGVDLPLLYDVEITGGASQAEIFYNAEPKILDFFAISPGTWGDQVGIRIRDIDYGDAAVSKITFSKFFSNGHNFNVAINDVSLVSAVGFSTDHVTTMNAIMTALKDKFNDLGYYFRFGSQTWENALSSNPTTAKVSDLEIYVRYQNFGNNITIVPAMSGTSPPDAAVEHIVADQEYTGEFTLEVYLKSDTSSPVETFRCTLHENVNASGYQTNIEAVVNEGASPSRYIRVVQPVSTKYIKNGVVRFGGVWRDTAKTILDLHTTIQWLGDGSAGSAITNDDIVNAWDEFLDKTKYTVKLLLNCGYSDPIIHRKMLDVAKTRRNSFALLDVPVGSQKVSALMEYRKFILGVDNSYGTLCAPYIKAVSSTSPSGRYIPPSGHVGWLNATQDKSKMHIAAAGLERGVISSAINVQERYSKADLDLLCPIGISPIISKYGQIVLWDANTLQRKKSALSVTHIRRTLSEIEDNITRFVEYYLQDPTNDQTRFAAIQRINTYLSNFKGDGLSFVLVKSDNQNNSASDTAVGRIVIDIYLTFVMPVREIKLRSILIDGTITFQEITKQLAT